MDEKLQKAAEVYLLNRKWADQAYAARDFGASCAHRMVAHIFLREYAAILGVTTDEAAAHMRRSIKQ